MAYSVRRFFRDLGYVMHQEFRAILKDRGVCVFLFLVPFAYPLIYGAIYNPEVVNNVPIVVVDQDNSFLSREYTRRLDATSMVDVMSRVPDIYTAKKMVDKHDAYGYIIIPKSFQETLTKADHSAQVEVVADLASIFYYKAAMLAATDVAIAMGRDLQSQNKFAGSRILTQIQVKPIRIEVQAMYNPVGGYASFLLPAILILVLQQALLLGICMMVGTARAKSQKSYIDPVKGFKRGLPLRVIWGRSIVYFFIMVVSVLWTLVVIPRIYNLPMLYAPTDLIVFIIPYCFAVIFFAETVALFVKGREEPMLFLVFTSVLFLFLMGVSWPWSALSPFWKIVGNLVPAAPAARGYVALISMGASIFEIKNEYINLWILALFYMLTASLGQRFLIKRKRKNEHE